VRKSVTDALPPSLSIAYSRLFQEHLPAMKSTRQTTRVLQNYGTGILYSMHFLGKERHWKGHRKRSNEVN
jgi:hypothetical protein